MMSNDLFLRLSRYAPGPERTPIENFFTELIRYFFKKEPVACREFLEVALGTEEARNFQAPEVETQVRPDSDASSLKDRKLDLVVRSGKKELLVENKVDAPLYEDQLSNYLKYANEPPEAWVVVASRDHNTIVEEARFTGHPLFKGEVRWWEVADRWEKRRAEFSNKWLIEGVLEFMRGRGLTMDHVGKELVPGIQAISSFMAMLEHALDELDIRKLKKTSWVEAVGCLFHIGRRFFAARIFFSEPSKLQLTEFTRVSGKWKWVRDCGSSDLVEVGFFDLPKEGQIEHLKSFIKKETAGGKGPRS